MFLELKLSACRVNTPKIYYMDVLEPKSSALRPKNIKWFKANQYGLAVG